MMNSQRTMDILNSSYLMLLGAFGSYIGNNLTCKVQKLMEDNIYLRNIVLVILVYFTVSVSTSEPLHPVTLMNYTGLITLVFIIINKMTLPFTFVSYIIFSGIYIISNFITYYEHKKIKEKTVERLRKLQSVCMVVFLSIVVVGFSLYFTEKRIEYKGNNWSTYKFLLGGVVKCKGVKDGI